MTKKKQNRVVSGKNEHSKVINKTKLTINQHKQEKDIPFCFFFFFKLTKNNQLSFKIIYNWI